MHTQNYPPIPSPVSASLLKKELSEEFLLRNTARASNQIYTFRAYQMPNVMKELGRLREEAFRYYGGGSGKELDIDEFDLDPQGYTQLIVWDPRREEIVGGYRYILGEDVPLVEGQPKLASGEIFEFSPTFIHDYLPKTIELGRSFVRLDYQQARLTPKSIFALDNLWDGLGALCLLHPQCAYFFGKVTIFRDEKPLVRDLIIYYLQKYFWDIHSLVTPLYPVSYTTPLEELRKVIPGKDPKEDYKRLASFVRDIGGRIPPLLNAYIGLSQALVVHGTSSNPFFSDVEETALIIPIKDIAEDKKKRHVESFLHDVVPGHRVALLKRLRERLRRPMEPF